MAIVKPISTTNIKKNVIEGDIFKREITLCQSLSKDNGGKCNWGVCRKCGVIPLLLKLHKGVLLEDPKEISLTKNKILS